MDDLEQDLKELELLESSKTSKNKIIIIDNMNTSKQNVNTNIKIVKEVCNNILRFLLNNR